MKKGIVLKVRGTPQAHSFDIQDEDGNIYFAHLGDIKENEDLLYQYNQVQLKKDDTIEFDAVDFDSNKCNRRAIHIKKL